MMRETSITFYFDGGIHRRTLDRDFVCFNLLFTSLAIPPRVCARSDVVFRFNDREGLEVLLSHRTDRDVRINDGQLILVLCTPPKLFEEEDEYPEEDDDCAEIPESDDDDDVVMISSSTTTIDLMSGALLKSEADADHFCNVLAQLFTGLQIMDPRYYPSLNHPRCDPIPLIRDYEINFDVGATVSGRELAGKQELIINRCFYRRTHTWEYIMITFADIVRCVYEEIIDSSALRFIKPELYQNIRLSGVKNVVKNGKILIYFVVASSTTPPPQ